MKEVFYRQFRPNQFFKMVGQDAAMAILTSNCASNSFHHAYMFAGASGSGKTTAARILAAVINCTERPDGSAEACGKCASCIAISEGAAVDFREIDGGSQGGKDEIKKIIECSMFSPSMMKERIFIIDEAHELSSAAWTALLKPTEEPKSHVVYIFCTSEYSKVPKTIASRCRRVNFRSVSQDVIARYLYQLSEHLRVKLGRDVPECSAEALGQIASVADGNMRDALNYLESMFLVYDSNKIVGIDEVRDFLGLVGRDSLYDIVDAIAGGDTGKALDITVSIGETAPDYRQVCKELGNVFRNILLVSAGVDGVLKISDMESERVVSAASKVSVERACVYCGMFAEAIRAFDVNADKRWVLESLVARLSKV
jgi:DNA polymerase-3 subunit gamma/tau